MLRMQRIGFRWRLPVLVIGLFTPVAGAQGESPRDISELLEPIRGQRGVPALAAAAMRGDEIIALGATGLRKVRSETTVTTDDLFHIGSCTKSMTATVAAMLVEDGVITWDTTVAEALPDLADDMQEQYRDVTLRMLLAHRSGLPEDRSPPKDIWPRIRMLRGPMHEQRIAAAQLALGQEPVAEPGEAMNYSNFGYVVAGTMLEEATGKTWEELMRTRLFEPLNMRTAGFGPPGADAEVDPDAPTQPWGHAGTGDKAAAIRPGPLADNPPLLGPAGTVHASMTDMARYASFHLTRGEGTDLLTPESFDILHDPHFGGDYALGWVKLQRPWAKGTVLMHDGSNGMWYMMAWIAPELDMAFVAGTNVAGTNGPWACDDAINALIITLLADDEGDNAVDGGGAAR